MKNLCTLYSSENIENRLIELINELFNSPKLKVDKADSGSIFKFAIKKGFLKGNTGFQLSTRFRSSNAKLEEDSSDLAQNLLGLKGFISQIQAAPKTAIDDMNIVIDNVVSETAILCSDDESEQLKALVKAISKEKNCMLFCQTDTFVGKGNFPHFLSKNMELLLDINGNSEIYPQSVPLIDMEQQEKIELTPDQVERKKMNIEFIKRLGIKTIEHLPYTESESEVKIRTSEEIASRAVILAITNLLAFSNISGEQAIGLIEKYSLNKYVTPEEMDFLKNPTEESKNQMSWKCEAIWILCWALGIIDEIGPADELADLNKISESEYPIIPETDPNIFIQKNHQLRSAKAILDQNDLYYRLNWACVDARLNGEEITNVHPGVVYERQYALNWLVNYMGQEWDDVTCDT